LLSLLRNNRFAEKEAMLDSFILGLSSGSACLLTCGMVIFPYLMAGAAGTRKIIADVSIFLVTRCIVYFILATLAWYFGKSIFTSPVFRNYISGILYILFAVMLVWYSIDRNRKRDCPAKMTETISNKKLVPLFLGIVNSLGFCPALLLILTKSATQGTIGQSYLAFLGFFAGSSLYFLPLPLAGRVKKKEVFETIGILATGLAGIIFIIKGLTNIIGGLLNG
jgi:hypothetical protein